VIDEFHGSGHEPLSGQWLARYAQGGMGGLADRSSRPASCPHQMPAAVEARIASMRRDHPGWGPSRYAELCITSASKVSSSGSGTGASRTALISTIPVDTARAQPGNGVTGSADQKLLARCTVCRNYAMAD
jgi:hypothetical protein